MQVQKDQTTLNKTILVGGSLAIAVTAFLVWRRFYSRHGKKDSSLSMSTQHMQIQSCKSLTSITQASQKAVYDQPIVDQGMLDPPIYTPKEYKLQNLHYRIFLKTTKGLGYCGSVLIHFKLSSRRKKALYLQFNGSQILRLAINNKLIPEGSVRYKSQQILLQQKHLGNGINSVEVFFFNKYSFFDDGLSTYFHIDKQNRYSLKQQCIYTKSNKYSLPRVIPCFNQAGECEINLTLVHPENFIAFSNTNKRSIATFYPNEFKQYDSLFSEDRLTNSSSRLSARSIRETVKNITRFRAVKLTSIQQLFIGSLPFQEVKINNNTFTTLRFYCRREQVEIVSKLITSLLLELENIILKAPDGSKLIPNDKVDFLFIDSVSMNGFFTKGVIVLNQKLARKSLNIKTVYITLRAFVARFVTPKDTIQTLDLNKRVARLYPQCVNYLRLQEVKFRAVFQFKFPPEYLSCHEELYNRALKYYCPGLLGTTALEEMICMMEAKLDNYWEYFYAHLSHIQIPVLQLVTELSIRLVGQPQNQDTRIKLRDFFANSGLVLHFMTFEEIVADLPRLAVLNPRKLQLMVCSLELTHQQASLLQDTSVEKYIRTRQNIQECQQLYSQFLSFQESQNIHNMQLINEEIRRIKHVIKVQPSGKVSCSLVPAMILSRLQIGCVSSPVLAKMIRLLNDVVDLE